MIPPLLIAFFALLLLSYIVRHMKLKSRMNGIPAPPGYPIVGNALMFLKGGQEGFLPKLNETRKQYGSRYQLWMAGQPYIFTSNSNDFEKILSSREHIEKTRDYKYMEAWLGKGLVLNGGSGWHTRRKLLTPAFHFTILEDFLPVMCRQSDIFTEILAENKGREIDIFPFITRMALDIICETAMGKEINAQREITSVYADAVHRINALFTHRSMRPWLDNDWIWSLSSAGKEEARVLKVLHGFTDKVIQERKRGRTLGQRKQTRKPAFLDLILDYQENNPKDFTDVGIREEVDTFMFAGHDTTSANLAWTIFLIGGHPEVQAKVHAELDDVLSETGGEITTAVLSKLKYLESCIKESLRIYPSAPLISRKLGSDLKLDDNTVIPKEAYVSLGIYQAHHDPEVFKDPEAFRPERLGQMEKIAFNYTPFSAGPRNCIGQKFALMEEKVVLAKLFQKFKVTSLQKPEDITLLIDIILRPKEGIKVILESRE